MPAEIRMMQIIGSNVVSMSVVTKFFLRHIVV